MYSNLLNINIEKAEIVSNVKKHLDLILALLFYLFLLSDFI